MTVHLAMHAQHGLSRGKGRATCCWKHAQQHIDETAWLAPAPPQPLFWQGNMLYIC